MSYREAPNVKNIQRKYFFPEIFWLESKNFQEIEHKNEIKPYIIAADGQKMYIGKNVPDNSDYYNPMNMHEIIGAVIKDLNGEWCLHVPWGSTVHVLKERFVVLSINDENSYHWVNSSNGAIPSYALRGALDNDVSEFLYIGRTLSNNETGKYYRNNMFNDFNEPITPTVGKVHSSHKCLYVPVGERFEIALTEYQVLCLKPSPAPLKVLSRLVIRNKIGFVNNVRDKLRKLLPESIIKYLEYPTSLGYGEYMLKNEKLLSECGNFELFIDDKNVFVCKDIKKDLLISTTQNVESFYLHHNKIVMCKADGVKFEIFANISFNLKIIPNEYRFKFYTKKNEIDDTHTELKYFTIEILDDDGNLIHTEKIYRSVPIDIDEAYDRIFWRPPSAE